MPLSPGGQSTEDTPSSGRLPAPAIPAVDTQGLPVFPGEDVTPKVTLKTASASQLVVNGINYSTQSGANNGPGTASPAAWTIAPGGDDDLAYAVYSVGGFNTDRPVDLEVDTMSAIAPGGDDDLPLNYWIAFSDYTSYEWEWHGPYDQPTQHVLNGEDVRNRYVSIGGVLSFAIVSDASEVPVSAANPDGISAVQVVATTINALSATDEEYLPTLPYCAWLDSVNFGDDKGTSGLKPSRQYITLHWKHVVDPANPSNEAVYYQVLRELVGSGEGPVLLNTIPAPGLMFVDPRDSNELVPQAVPGATYRYFLRALNYYGATPFSRGWTMTIPLLPPTGVTGSDGASDMITLSWIKAEGATGYHIYRDYEANLVASVGDVSTWDDATISDLQSHTYWLRSFNQYASGEELSESGTGSLNRGPDAVLTVSSTTGEKWFKAKFDASESSDDNGNLVRFEWDWEGDGVFDLDSGTDATVEHWYGVGIFNATVRVTDNGGGTGTDQVIITVTEPVD